MSRAFVREDDSLVSIQDEDKALKERLERLDLLEKKKKFLESDPQAQGLDPEKREEFLQRINQDIAKLRELLS
ncbi:MAG: hypothetical protein JW971_02910 [Synergistales bacterium]|nr:hypothetical protein [Synergistales bacterium]